MSTNLKETEMIKQQDVKFDWDDITLVPSKLSSIRSRSDIYPYNYKCTLPVFTAPMDSLFNIEDKHFNKNFESKLNQLHFNVVKPRNINIFNFENTVKDKRNSHKPFKSYSLSSIKELYDLNMITNESKICIDVANGHMSDIIETCIMIKDKYPYCELMAGNIANPETILEYEKAKIDYCRVGIGNGGGCLTSQQTAVNYPMASLIRETYLLKKEHNLSVNIVADGGFKKYSDIIKALALGADYVMLGSVLAKSLESDNYPYLFKKIKIKNQDLARFLFKQKLPLYKKFRGMSTKDVQKIWGRKKLKTSEGVTRWYKVEYTIDGWVENFVDYLKSAMSYCNVHTLEEFKNSDFILISENSHKRFSK